MKAAASIALSVVAALSVSSPSAQSILKPQGSQGPLTPKAAQLQPKPTFEVICHGGPSLRLERQGARLGLFFSQSPVAPGADGSCLSMREGTCWQAKGYSGIEFGAVAEYDRYRTEVAESDRCFRFVVSEEPGMLIARDHRSWKDQTAPNPETARVIDQKAAVKDAAKPTEAAKSTEAAQKTADAPPKSAELKPAGTAVPNPAEKAGLNPQPLPPKDAELKPADRVLPSPVEKAGLNPQPPPPKPAEVVQQPPVKVVPNPVNRAAPKPGEEQVMSVGLGDGSHIQPPWRLSGTLVCRGGPALVWEGPIPVKRRRADLIPPGQVVRATDPITFVDVSVMRLIFQLELPQRPAGPRGLGLKPSQCTYQDKALKLSIPRAIEFDAASATFETLSGTHTPASRPSSVKEYLKDINHFWTFDVIEREFFYDVKAHRRLEEPILTTAENLRGSAATEAAQKQTKVSGAAPSSLESIAAARSQDTAPPATPVQSAEKALPGPGDKASAKPSPVSPGTPIAGRAPARPSSEKLQQKAVEILCRGGDDLRVERLNAPAADVKVTMGVFFLPPTAAAGSLGSGLPPGTCSFRGDQVFGPDDPGGIHFEAAANARAKPMLSGSVGPLATAAERFPDAETIPAYLKDPRHYWRFIAVNTHRGHFQATAHQHWKVGPVLAESDAVRGRAGELAIGRITDVRVTPRDRSVRLEFVAAPDATPGVLIVKGPAKVDADGVVLRWDTGAPMVLHAQRDANASSPTVTRYVADSLVHRVPVQDQLSMLEPATHYHYVISPDRNDTSRRVGGVFTTLAADATGAPAPTAASGAPSSGSAIDDRGIIIVGGRDAAGERGAAAKVTQSDVDKGLPGPPPRHAVVRPAEKVDLSLQQLAPTAPANLFELDDRTIIIVGGRQTTAGDVKREIEAELRRSAGPPSTFSVQPRRPVEAPNADTPLVATPGRLPRAAEPVQGQALGRVADLKVDCKMNWPRISHISGRISPGELFTINGMCFGSEPGYVEIIGQFEGSKLKARFRDGGDWTDTAIVAEMPDGITGIPDHTVAISVRRAGDAKQSVARPARFIADREEIDVPPDAWKPTGRFSVPRTTYGYVLERSHVDKPASFTIEVNPACALTTLDVPASSGGVLEVKGWDAGPPHRGTVEVIYQSHCVGRRERSWRQFEWACLAEFTLLAKASCPKGIGLAR